MYGLKDKEYKYYENVKLINTYQNLNLSKVGVNEMEVKWIRLRYKCFFFLLLNFK